MQIKAKSWFLLILLSVIWGSSFILMKKGLESFSSNEVAAIRIGLAFICLIPFLFMHIKTDLKKYGMGLILMGFFGNLIPAFLFTAAETQISSSLAGMLNALTPLFTIAVGAFWLSIRPTKKQLTGILIGLVAAIALTYFDRNNTPSKNALYGLLVVLATLCYAIAINSIRKYLKDIHPIAATAWAFTFTGPVCLIYLFGFSDFWSHLNQSPAAFQSLGYLSILAIVGTAFSVIIYNILIKEAGAIFASTCTYLIPVVAIIWGLIGYEKINIIQILSIGFIIASVYLINRK